MSKAHKYLLPGIVIGSMLLVFTLMITTVAFTALHTTPNFMWGMSVTHILPHWSSYYALFNIIPHGFFSY